MNRKYIDFSKRAALLKQYDYFLCVEDPTKNLFIERNYQYCVNQSFWQIKWIKLMFVFFCLIFFNSRSLQSARLNERIEVWLIKLDSQTNILSELTLFLLDFVQTLFSPHQQTSAVSLPITSITAYHVYSTTSENSQK